MAHAQMLIEEPVVIILKEDFQALLEKVKKLDEEYRKLENLKSCKKT